MQKMLDDRGPLDAERMVSAGSWSVYWYNGLIISSEIARGVDIYELLPSGLISQNEIDAAKPCSGSSSTRRNSARSSGAELREARAYLDQLERGSGLEAPRIAAARAALAPAETARGAARRQALAALAADLEPSAPAADAAKVRLLVQAVVELANQ
ncbi:MAG TPA: hypothetical protein VM364_05685 [Vicinamibacterales bacterium]|nr:hypothetical protein [Vicinamibacterales bacterium]